MATSQSSFKRQRGESSQHPHEDSISDDDMLKKEVERNSSIPIIHPGRVVTHIAFEGTPIFAQLEHHRLVDFLSCDGPIEESMIVDFYQTFEIDRTLSIISAIVNDKEICFNLDTFSKVLGLPSHGFYAYKHEAFPHDPQNFTARDNYYLMRMDTHNFMHPTYPWPHDLKILFRLIRRALFPTLRKVDDVTDWDKHIAYLILHKKPVDFCKLFIQHIEATRQVNIGLPYGLALMKLFKHLKVPMRTPFDRPFERTWRFDLATLKRMGLYRFKGNYLTQGEFDLLPTKVKVAIEDGIENDYTIERDDQVCIPSSFKDLAEFLSAKIDDGFKKIHERIDALESRIG